MTTPGTFRHVPRLLAGEIVEAAEVGHESRYERAD